MKMINSLEDLKNIELTELNENTLDTSAFRNYSKKISILTGYLLGVKEEFLSVISQSKEEYAEIIGILNTDENAQAIRHLNNLRSNLILYFKKVSRTIRISSAEYTPIYNIEYLSEDFKALNKLGISISTGRTDISEYIKIINNEIIKRIDAIEYLFPDWINFKYIRNLFVMPGDIKSACAHYQNNQDYYPYKRYFNWKNPKDCGNILTTDAKMLYIVYKNSGDYFQNIDKVMDASDNVKNNINEFIKNGTKIQIFIDGENVDPYRFVSTLEGLKEYEISKIDKLIVYYDKIFSSKAWEMLKHFSCGIEVETNAIERIKDGKSLVDHKLVAGVSKAYYNDNVDSIILVSSDSDFWSVIEDIEVKYLVLVESDKCGNNFKDVLRKHNIFYCYLDKFITPENNMFFKTVFRNELQNSIKEGFKLESARKLMNDAILQSRATIPDAERENLYKKYIRGLKLDIDKDGNFHIIIPE